MTPPMKLANRKNGGNSARPNSDVLPRDHLPLPFRSDKSDRKVPSCHKPGRRSLKRMQIFNYGNNVERIVGLIHCCPGK